MRSIFVNDIVVIIDTQSIYHGEVGLVLPNNLSDHMYSVSLRGGSVLHYFRREDIDLLARSGTKTHTRYLSTGEIEFNTASISSASKMQRAYQDTALLAAEDYLDLIDLALDLKDYALVHQWSAEMAALA